MTRVRVRFEMAPRTTRIYGEGRDVVPPLKALRCRRQWDKTRRCWAVPANIADDVLAAIEEWVGGDVHVEQVDR